MPTYDFKNNDTGEVKEYIMTIAEMEQFKKDNPKIYAKYQNQIVHSIKKELL